jgi:predicted RND superfamily exporter protein
MRKFSDFISNHNILILVISLLLIIPSIIGYANTKINYDILVYLPENYETIKGEKILTDDFGLGSYAFVMVDMSDPYKVMSLEGKIRKIDGVKKVFSINDVIGSTIPKDMLPDKVRDKLYNDDTSIIMVTFNDSTSADSTVGAVDELRSVVGDASKISSMTSLVLDTRDISNSEMLIYVVISVFLCLIVLIFATDSYVIPLFLLGNIGIAILYNMGTNVFLGDICYITKAITAVLQLGVTTDYSIFLYHKYEQIKKTEKDKRKAMSLSIIETFKSVVGSSLTTFSGFLALCTMDLTLGTDIGIVMAKGVLFGLVTVFTIFPACILTFDNLITKTQHKKLFPDFKRVQKFTVKNYVVMFVIFLLLVIPAVIGNNNYQVYYKLDDALPADLPFHVANSDLAKKFNIVSPEIILLDKNIKNDDVEDMVNEIKSVKGISLVLSPNVLMDDTIKNLMPEDLSNLVENDKYQIVLVNSKYEVASDKLNKQITEVDKIIKKYDKKAILAGEGPLMKDLVVTADHDFKMVNYTSIIVIFIIMLFVLQSIGLPIILIFAIEFAIFLNMACAYFTGTKLPFVASIVVGTIQLGATIDYAILMSTKYLEERHNNKKDKIKAIKDTLSVTVPSIITSALCFFAATVGVSLYTKIDMIGSICTLLSRGSIISMLVVVLILPALLIIFDKFIMKTTKFKEVK